MLAARRMTVNRLELVEIEEPKVHSDGEVIIDVLFAGVNPFDAQVLRGEIGDPSRVITLGAEATGLLDGHVVQVSGSGIGAVRDGTYARKVVAPRSAVRALPEGVDPAVAATVGVAGKTAWRAVRQLAQVQEDDVVLVLGASGGVGIFAAQLAKAAGATVLAQTGSAAKAHRLEALGLEPIVAADAAHVRAQVADRSVSVVLDPLGGDYVSSLLDVLQPSSRIVAYGVLGGRTTQVNLGSLFGRGLRWLGTSGGTTPPAEAEDAIRGVFAAIAAGDLVVEFDALPLADAGEVFDRLARRQVEGKLLLDARVS